jgi:Tol biopolymer transport system component
MTADPSFSPDGKRIVWRRFDVHGMIADVWTMNIDGSDQTQVSQFSAMSLGTIFPRVDEIYYFHDE